MLIGIGWNVFEIVIIQDKHNDETEFIFAHFMIILLSTILVSVVVMVRTVISVDVVEIRYSFVHFLLQSSAQVNTDKNCDGRCCITEFIIEKIPNIKMATVVFRVWRDLSVCCKFLAKIRAICKHCCCGWIKWVRQTRWGAGVLIVSSSVTVFVLTWWINHWFESERERGGWMLNNMILWVNPLLLRAMLISSLVVVSWDWSCHIFRPTGWICLW